MTDADVAIVGSGPAGLAAAIELRRLGVARVVVLERETHAGGVPRHCAHPTFGWHEYRRLLTGPAYAARNVAAAHAAGVDVRTRASVVALHAGGRLDVTNPHGVETIDARRVLLATGARESPRSARLIGGDRPAGVLNTGTLQQMLHLEHSIPFRRPLIVGTELVALSALADCLRAGIRPVAMIEARARPTAPRPLAAFARCVGVPLWLGARLERIVGDGRVTTADVRRADGRVHTLACDGVLLTGAFTPEAALVRASGLALDPASEGPSIDEYGRSSDPACYAAGNVLRAIETGGWAYREGVRVARAIAADFAGRLPAPQPFVIVACAAPVKLCVPQRLSGGVRACADSAHAALQLRVTHAVRGRLRIDADGRNVWSRTLACLPERRLTVPLAALAFAPGTMRLDVHFDVAERA